MIKDLCFEVTQKCLNNCVFCSSRSSEREEVFIKFDVFKRTIDFFMANGGIGEISFSGGEPLLHPNILDMIEYCSNLNIRTVLYTSGLVSNDEKFYDANEHVQKILDFYNNQKFTSISRELLAELKKRGLKKIVFDFQGADECTYNKMMGTENGFIHLASSICRATNPELGFETSIHFVPTKLNIATFADLIEIADIAEICELRVLKFVPQGRGFDNREQLQLTNEELKQFVLKHKNCKPKKTELKFGIPLQGENDHLCTAGLDKLDIKFDGTVLPCPAFKELNSAVSKKLPFKEVNIYKNLEDFKFSSQKFYKRPLCGQIYNQESEK